MSESRISKLKTSPKSQVIKEGYINIYSKLSPKEEKQIKFKTLYKKENPEWDETQVYLSKKLSELESDNLVILDAGCGHGNYVIDENRSKIDWAVGGDVAKEVTSRNVCLDEIKHERLENLSFDNNHFDACISLWVFEHLEHPKEAIEEIYRVLKPNGYFMFATPNKNYLPLIFMRILKSRFLNHLLNKFLFGRKSEDIFESYYQANTVRDIKDLLDGKFEIEELKYNYDPSYLSFNKPFYKIANLVYKVTNACGLNLFKPHIIGVLKKRTQPINKP